MEFRLECWFLNIFFIYILLRNPITKEKENKINERSNSNIKKYIHIDIICIYYVYAYIEFPCIYPPGVLSGKLPQTETELIGTVLLILILIVNYHYY